MSAGVRIPEKQAKAVAGINDQFAFWEGDIVSGKQKYLTTLAIVERAKDYFYTKEQSYDLFSPGNSTSFDTYDDLTTYVGGQTYYVNYNGLIFQFDSLTDQTGKNPIDYPEFWSPVGVGELAHLQNTDDYLDLGGDYEISAQELREFVDSKAQPDGLASLAADGKLTLSQLPDLAVTEFIGNPVDQSAMLALSGQSGDWCIRQDDEKVYVIIGDPSTPAGWQALSYPNQGVSGGLADRVTLWSSASTLTYSAVTATELGYLTGVTSSIQAQLNAKANLSGATFTGGISATSYALNGTAIVSAAGVLSNVSGNVSMFSNDAGYLTSADLNLHDVTSGAGNNTTTNAIYINNNLDADTFSIDGVMWLSNSRVLQNVSGNISMFTNDVGYLTAETDPIFTAHVASGITQANIDLWNAGGQDNTFTEVLTAGKNVKSSSHGSGTFGNGHKYFTLEDAPSSDKLIFENFDNGDFAIYNSQLAVNNGGHNAIVFRDGSGGLEFYYNGVETAEFSSVGGFNIKAGGLYMNGSKVIGTGGQVTNAWGNISMWTNDVGYLTSYTETDPIFTAHAASNVTNTKISNWDTAYGWGNHASAGYLTSYSETDPIFTAHAASNVTNTKISNWDTAYGWGNHASAGYLTSLSAYVGGISTTSHITSGRGSGGVALTINDGYGNANVTWNHKSGKPEQAGSAFRIEGTTDSTTATMSFEMKSNVAANVAVGLTQWMKATPSAIDMLWNTNFAAGIDVTGNITVTGTVDGIDMADLVVASGITQADVDNWNAGGGINYGADTQVAYMNGTSAFAYSDNLKHDGTNTWIGNTAGSLYVRAIRAIGSPIEVYDHMEFQDNDELRFGTGSDFRIWFNGTDTVFRNYAHAGGDIIFQGEDSAGGLENMMILDTSGTSGYVRLFQNSSEKARTISAGLQVYGQLQIDSDQSGHSLSQMWVNSNNSDAKILLWGTSTSYAIGMSNAFSYGSVTDFAMTFTMSNNDDRGWIWKDTNGDYAASLSTTGVFRAASQIRGDTLQGRYLILDANFTGSGTLLYLWDDSAQATKGFVQQVSPRGGLKIGADDVMIIGSGESATYINSNVDSTHETTYVGSDNDIHFITNTQSGVWADRKQMTFASDGTLLIGENNARDGKLWLTRVGSSTTAPRNTGYASVYVIQSSYHYSHSSSADLFLGESGTRNIVRGIIDLNSSKSTLGSTTASNARLIVGGQVTDSSAIAQFNGFVRVGGEIYVHSANGIFFNNSGYQIKRFSSSNYGTLAVSGGTFRNGYTGLMFDDASGDPGIMFNSEGDGGLYSHSAGWAIFTDRSTGGHVIGGYEDQSGYKLTVNGNTYVTGTVYTTSNVTGYSDESKKNFRDNLDDALDRIIRYKGKAGRYTWIDGRGDRSIKIGYGAQSMHRVFPEIGYKDEHGRWGVDYANMSTVNMRGIQQLHAKMMRNFETQDQKIQRLESRVKELENKIAA